MFKNQLAIQAAAQEQSIKLYYIEEISIILENAFQLESHDINVICDKLESLSKEEVVIIANQLLYSGYLFFQLALKNKHGFDVPALPPKKEAVTPEQIKIIFQRLHGLYPKI